MSEPIVVIDTSAIRQGALAEVKAGIRELVSFVEQHVPGALVYNVYLNEDGTRMTVLQMHPDSASMEQHMELGRPVFARFAELLTMETMDIYGRPSERLLVLLQRKAQMLAGPGPTVHERHGGLLRLGPR